MQAWSLVDPARPCGSSVDPIQSAVRKQSAKKGNINQGKGDAKQYHRKGEENGSATQRRKRKATLPKEAAPPIRDEEVKAAHPKRGGRERTTTQKGKEKATPPKRAKQHHSKDAWTKQKHHCPKGRGHCAVLFFK